jgi:hypothetical protein
MGSWRRKKKRKSKIPIQASILRTGGCPRRLFSVINIGINQKITVFL